MNGGSGSVIMGGARLNESSEVRLGERKVKSENREKDNSGSPIGTWRRSTKSGLQEETVAIRKQISLLKTMNPEGDGEQIGEVLESIYAELREKKELLEVLSGGELEQKRAELEKLEEEISSVERSLDEDEGSLTSSGRRSLSEDSPRGSKRLGGDELTASDTKPLTKTKMSRLIEKTLAQGSKVDIKEEELVELYKSMRNNVPVRIKKQHFKIYKGAFVGSDAVDWLIQYKERGGNQISREQALWLGNFIMSKGYFNHITQSLPLQDSKKTWYYFNDDLSAYAPEGFSTFIGNLQISLCEIKNYPRKSPVITFFSEHQLFKCSDEWKSGMIYHFFIFRSNSELVVELNAKEKVHNKARKPLGYVSIPIKDLALGQKVDKWYSMILKKPKKFKQGVPEIRLVLFYQYLYGTKDEGTALPPPEFNPAREITTSSRHTIGTKTKVKGHRPNHRVCANNNVFKVVENLKEWEEEGKKKEGEESGKAFIQGVFYYGLYDLVKEKVETFVMTEPPYGRWLSLGVDETDKNGRLINEVPFEAFPIQSKHGHYPVRMVVLGDLSVAAGQLWCLKPGTAAVLYDIDGTITPGDEEIIKQVVFDSFKAGYTPILRLAAVSLVRAWAVKGYLPVYLSGRAGSAYNLTRNWLIRYGFPPGVILHTDKHAPTLPTYSSVGVFKRDHILYMQDKLGIKVGALYGNTKTDIVAYEEAGHPKETTFILGKFGGQRGTVAVGEDFMAHVQYVMEQIPDADVPAPREFFDW